MLLVQGAEFANGKDGKITINGDAAIPMSQFANEGTIALNGTLQNSGTVKAAKGAEIYSFSAIEGYEVANNPGVYIYDGKTWISDGFP